MTADVMTRPEAGIEHNEMQEAAEVYRAAVERLEDIDEALAELLVRRTQQVAEMARAKRSLGLPIFNGAREAQVIERFVTEAEQAGIARSQGLETIACIVSESRRVQSELGNGGPQPLDKESAYEVIEYVRAQIDEIDPAIAGLLGERLATADIVREARIACGGTPRNLDSERNELGDFLELAEAGGVRAAAAHRIISPYMATV